MARNRILIVDDEVGVRFGIRDFLQSKGFDVDEADSCRMAQEAFRANRPDVALIDYRLPDGNALELLPRLKAIDADVPIIILTAHGSIDLAVQAIKEGAEQFFTKPIELPALLVVVQRQIEIARELQKQQAGRKKQARDIIDPFIGQSPAIRQLAEGQEVRLAPPSGPWAVVGYVLTGMMALSLLMFLIGLIASLFS